MKQFDLNRFTKVLCCDFVTRRKQLVLIGGGLLVFDLLISFYNLTVGRNMAAFAAKTSVESVDPAKGIIGMCLALLGMFMLVAASRIFVPEQKKPGRINMLVLPATLFEKFAARWVYAVVYTLLAGVLAFVITDVLVQLFCLIKGWQVSWMTLTFLHDMTILGEVNDANATLDVVRFIDGYVALFAFHGLFVLGAVLFRRNNFIITFGIFLAVSYLLMLGVMSVDSLAECFRAYNRSTWPQELCYLAVALSFLIVSYWLSYRIFCRMQVINNKWLNV